MSISLRNLLLIPVVLCLADPLRADETADFERLLKEKSDAIVNVKYVLKLGGQFGDREQERESSGVMIDPRGIVLCSSAGVGSSVWLRRLGGGSATPTDIKVIIGDDEEGVDAKLLASDSELDLAWVQIKEPAEKPYAHVDLAKATVPRIGNRLLTIRRMGKHFDRTPVVSEGRLFGQTRKPRDLYVPGGGLDAQPGMPIFSQDGAFVGIVVVQLPDPDEMESAQSMGSARDFASLILPASEVTRASERARAGKGEGEEMSAKAIAASQKAEEEAKKEERVKGDEDEEEEEE